MSQVVALAEIREVLKKSKRVTDKVLLEVATIAIKETLGDRLNEEITMESKFVDLEADSLDLVELVMFLEEAFGIEIPDEYSMDIVTFGDAIKVIKECKKNKGKKRKIDKSKYLKKPNPAGPIGTTPKQFRGDASAKKTQELADEIEKFLQEDDSEGGDDTSSSQGS